eukprot:Skav223656  [mRNA]  locus=scaffold4170:136667:136927:+ [translate_table: standard]
MPSCKRTNLVSPGLSKPAQKPAGPRAEAGAKARALEPNLKAVADQKFPRKEGEAEQILFGRRHPLRRQHGDGGPAGEDRSGDPTSA